jgi:hypothetical protein
MRFTNIITTYAIGLILCLFSFQVQAWGPISHQTFNCLALHPTMDVGACITSVAGGTFGFGSDAPDMFGFGAFNITDDPQYLCKNLTYVHDPVFAGFMVQLALNQSASSSSTSTSISTSEFDTPNSTFDAVSFSQAFAGHIMGDLVGFNAQGGVLCSKEASQCNAAGILYMPEWGYMAALDAFFFHTYNMSQYYKEMPVPNSKTLGPDGARFISQASYLYSQTTPSFAPVSPEAVLQCASYWRGNMQYVYDRAMFYDSSAQNQQFLMSELEFFLPKHATHASSQVAGKLADASSYILAQAACASATVEYFMKNIQLPGADPLQTVKQAVAFVSHQYMNGGCMGQQS